MINNYIVNNNHVRVELAVTKSLRIIAHSLAICFSVFKVQIQQTINYIQIAFELFEGKPHCDIFRKSVYILKTHGNLLNCNNKILLDIFKYIHTFYLMEIVTNSTRNILYYKLYNHILENQDF